MKSREKIVLTVMVLLFLLSVSMFYYQNVYKVKELEKDMVQVLVAKEDISKNSELSEENTEWVKIDKKVSTEDNVFKKDNISEFRTSTEIYKGEFISKKRLKDVSKKIEDDEFNSYIINLNPDYTPELNEGDLIKVYAQVIEEKDGKEEIKNLLIFDKKEILGITGFAEDGRSKQGEGQIKIKVTDKEALSYYNAKQMGSIIVLKYENDLNKTDLEIPVIEISQ